MARVRKKSLAVKGAFGASIIMFAVLILHTVGIITLPNAGTRPEGLALWGYVLAYAFMLAVATKLMRGR